MTDELLNLAERCEQADGADRRIDTLIEIALTPDRQWIVGEEPGPFPRKPIYQPLSSLWEWASDATKTPPEIGARQFTASLDAAATLVPAGRAFDIRFAVDAPCQAEIYFAGSNQWFEHEATAATGALALCAAALRACAASCDTLPKGQDREDGLDAEQG